MATLTAALSKTANQLSLVGRRVTSVDDLVDLHLDLADGALGGRRIHTMVDLTLGSEDPGNLYKSFIISRSSLNLLRFGPPQ